MKNLEGFDFKNFLSIQEQYIKQLNYLGLNEYSKEKVLKIQLENITKIANEFSNSDIVLKNIKELENLQKQINKRFTQENITINKSFSNLTENGTKNVKCVVVVSRERLVGFSDFNHKAHD